MKSEMNALMFRDFGKCWDQEKGLYLAFCESHWKTSKGVIRITIMFEDSLRYVRSYVCILRTEPMEWVYIWSFMSHEEDRAFDQDKGNGEWFDEVGEHSSVYIHYEMSAFNHALAILEAGIA